MVEEKTKEESTDKVTLLTFEEFISYRLNNIDSKIDKLLKLASGEK